VLHIYIYDISTLRVKRMAREPPHSRWQWSHSHGDTAGVQRMAREPCHVETAGE